MKHILAYFNDPGPIESYQATECSEASFGSDSALCTISWLCVESRLPSCFFAHISSISLPKYAAQCQYMLRGVVFPLKIQFAFLRPTVEPSLVDRHPLCTEALVVGLCLSNKGAVKCPWAVQQGCCRQKEGIYFLYTACKMQVEYDK